VTWPDNGHPRRAAVSSFGISGTNAHTIVEQAPPLDDAHGAEIAGAPASPECGDPECGDTAAEQTAYPVPYVLSARSAVALRAQAKALRAYLAAHPAAELVDVGFSLATTRSALERRAVIVADDGNEFLAGLDALAQGQPSHDVVLAGESNSAKSVFLFTGQGSQQLGMGRQLYQAYPAFARALDEASTHLNGHLDRPLSEVMWAAAGSTEAALLDHTVFTQAALFAFEVALFRLLESWGLRPDFVAGHSIGEVAAAHVAGVLSMPDACTLVAARGRLMQAVPGGGAMVSIQAAEEEVRPMLAGREHQVAVAAVNSPASLVVSGDETAVLDVANHWQTQGRKVKRLRVSHAFHSPHMDGMLDELRRVAQSLSFSAPTIPLVSTLTGELATAAQLGSPDYWGEQARQPVRFLDAMRWLQGHGAARYLELGPDGVLVAMAHDCLAVSSGGSRPAAALLVPALRRDRPEVRAVITAVATLHVHGVTVDWPAAFDGRDPRRMDLPTYAFQRQRYWLEATRPDAAGDAGAAASAEHRLWEAVEREDLESLAVALDVECEAPLSAVLPALSAWRRQRRWRYRITWKPLPATSVPPLAGTWLVVVPADQVDSESIEGAIRALVEHGARAVRIPVDAGVQSQDVAQRLAEALAGCTEGGPPAGVLSLLALDESTIPDRAAVPAGLAATLALLPALATAAVEAPLWIATRGAVSTGPSDAPPSPVQALVWGLGGVLSVEHPEAWGGLVDLPAASTERCGVQLAGALADPGGENEIAVRASGTFARRLVRVTPRQAAERRWKPQGTVLVTGASTALGAAATHWLAGNGAKHLVLAVHREARGAGTAGLEADLKRLGVDVTAAACDPADRDALAELLAEHRPTAVVHVDAALDGDLGDVTVDQLDHLLHQTISAAVNLDELTRDQDMSAFVVFSSIAGTLGIAGAGNHAAGHAFLEALAGQRQARGLPALTVAWGPWSDQTTGGGTEGWQPEGLHAVLPKPAIAVLERAVQPAGGSLVIADVEWERFLAGRSPAHPHPLFRDLPDVMQIQDGEPGSGSAPAGGPSIRQRLASMSPDEQERVLLELIHTEVASVLGHTTAAQIETASSFLELGFSSFTALELNNRLGAALELTLSPIAIYDNPTPDALVEYIRTELAGERGAGTTGPDQP
jgi:acyl transferase domain-containing protein